MAIIWGSVISYIAISLFFYYYLYRFSLDIRMHIVLSFVLGLLGFNIHSTLFMLMLHFAVLTLIMDSILCIFHVRQPTKYKYYVFFPFSLFLSLAFILYGTWNMHTIVRKQYNIQASQTLSKPYRIVLMADMHYPTNLTRSELSELLNRICNEEGDALILAGDMIDEFTSEKEIKDLYNQLSVLAKDIPVIYVLGNHDNGIYGTQSIDDDTLEEIIESYGMICLRDSSYFINDELLIIGRDNYKNKARKSIDELTQHINNNTFNIMVDHKPMELIQTSLHSINLHLSGHTHGGQIFPMYYLYEVFNINELNYGLASYNQMKAINTSGVAGWGFPVRTQFNSEYVVIDIN